MGKGSGCKGGPGVRGLRIVFLGPPGAGKGTHAKFLTDSYGIPHISTGDIVRETSLQDTLLGRKIRNLINSGNLVPDDIMNPMLRERLERGDCRKGFILDGYPRTVEQAEFLDSITEIDTVLDIDTSRLEIVKRLSSRLFCSCGASYNSISNPPKKTGICDRCGGTLFRRKDDNPDAIKKRYLIYQLKTKSLRKYYTKRGKIVHINGNQPIDIVRRDILNAVRNTKQKTIYRK